MNLQKLRHKAKLTQEQLAKKLNCHKQQVYNFESGRAPLPFKYAKRLASSLKVSEKSVVAYLIAEKTKRWKKAGRIYEGKKRA